MKPVKSLPKLTLKGAIRFCSSIKLSDSKKCWEWTGDITKTGYAIFWFGMKPYSAHRLAYAIHNHVDPDEMFVCHKCDNRKCVNPNHLFLGTHEENMQDMVIKGRNRRGERNGQSKLLRNDVVEIKKMLADGLSGREIAKQFGVTDGCICAIKNKRTWGHV